MNTAGRELRSRASLAKRISVPPTHRKVDAMNRHRTTTLVAILATTMLTAVTASYAQLPGSDSTAATIGEDSPLLTNERVGVKPIKVSNLRPRDARGLNVFEPPKAETVPFEGFVYDWGAAFTQQFQMLEHANTRDTSAARRLIEIGKGYNNENANLYFDAQLARGIRMEMTAYLSSRHHSETWVKDGYLLVDGSPWDVEVLDNLMKYLTLKVGHFEINYGDMHFKRSDNGQTIHNPLVGNLIMDAFTTEIGAEAYLRSQGFMLMVGATGGEIRGQVSRPKDRAPSYLAKAGFDRQFAPNARVRLTGSYYTTDKSVNNTLYSGSRAGSRYYLVVEPTTATEAAQAWSGDLQPGFRSEVTAWVVNPFVKLWDLELFGNIEQAEGRAATEATERSWNQYAGEAVYRLFGEQVWVAGRYNVADGRLAGMANDVEIERIQIGGGWFITPSLGLKAEYVRQEYRDFPTTDIRYGGRFEGAMIEGVVAF
jgi:hypothetical protein